MAHADNSLVTGKIRGSLGKQLVFREWAGKTIVAKAPKKRSSDPTVAQAAIQDKFLLASKYAKVVTTNPDPSLADAYKTSLRARQNIYSRAMEDFMNPPVVKSLVYPNYNGAVGNNIIVRAIDDFRVTGVFVEIYDATGNLLETGNAMQNTNGIDWTFTTTVSNAQPAGSRIKAIATDVPGNEGTLEVIV